jgi:hypothetical protein
MVSLWSHTWGQLDSSLCNLIQNQNKFLETGVVAAGNSHIQEMKKHYLLKTQTLRYSFMHSDSATAPIPSYSIWSGGQYVTQLHIKIGWREVKSCCFGSAKWFWPNVFAQFAEAGKRHSKAVHLLEKSVINVVWLLLPVFDWPIIMMVGY